MELIFDGDLVMNLIFDDEDDLDLNIRIRRAPRIFLDRVNFNMEDPYFVEKFRMPKVCVEFLVERLGGFLVHPTNCNKPLSPLQQILITLHWLGNGSQYHGVGKMHGVSKATICRCVNKVCSLIEHYLLGEEVKWPENRNEVAKKFFRIAGMPRIAGVIDGTLIPIDAPSVNEQAFVDRKGHHSLNVMLVAGADYRFYVINSNYPGSVHDSRILRCSRFFAKWEDEGWRPFPDAIIIGDSAYPLKKWLFTPNIANSITEGPAKNRFLSKFKKTRQIVESSIGQLKEIFPCLNRLRLKTALSCAKVINACVTLYNIRKRMYDENIILPDFNDEEDENEENDEDENDSREAAMEALRNYINYFN